MQIAILGTGMVGRTLGADLAAAGHAVSLGTRDPAATTARALDDGSTMEHWLDAHRGVRVSSFADVADGADLVINATAGAGTLDAVSSVRAGALDGTVLLDVSNPLDFSHGFPPLLSIANADSLGEQLQRAVPAARVVKGLNTLTAALMLHPALLPEPTSLFVCGNDAGAKSTVTALLESFGWADVIDLGDITSARGTEMWLPLWLRTMGALGSATFNLRIVR